MSDEGRDNREVVLIVDDNRDARELMGRILRDEGLHVVEAESGVRALELMAKVRVDLIVTDVVMDDVDGVQLCRQVKEHEAYRHVPVVFVTAQPTIEDVAQLFDVGAAEFIHKPFKVSEFLIRIQNVLRHTRRERELRHRTSILERTVEQQVDEVERLREFSHDIVSSLFAWLLVVDEQQRLRFANRALCEFRGVEAAEIMGQEIASLLPAELIEQSSLFENIEACLRENEPRRLSNVLYTTGEGEQHVGDVRINPISLGGRRHVLLVILDVTDHWQAEQAVRQEKSKLEGIVDGVGVSLALLDRDLRVVWCNRIFEQWFGALVGQPFPFALHGIESPEGHPLRLPDPERGDPPLEVDRIFSQPEHRSQPWAHLSPDSGKRFYRNVIVPSRETDGRIRELVIATQDLTEITLRAEQHRLLRELTHLLQTTLDRDRLLYTILTCVTAGHALGFNRAFIFLVSPDGQTLEGVMGVGPASAEEAYRIWAELAGQRKSLQDLTAGFDEIPDIEEIPLTKLVRELRYPLHKRSAREQIVARTAIENRMQLVTDAASDPRVAEAFRERIGANEFVCAPLQSKGRVVGVLLADNVYSGRPPSADQLEILELFAGPAGLAIENALTYAELKLRMEQLRKAQDALVHSEKLAAIGAVAARVAHEIRNPLVTIGGFARATLRKPDDTERVRHNTQIIFEEVRRLENILGDVMDFTKPARPKRRMLNVNAVVERLAEIVEEQMREREIEFEIRTDPDLPDCPVDETQMFQVLHNLVRNGMESMRDEEMDGREKRIVVWTRSDGNTVQVAITDTGRGIDPDDLSRMFEPFFTTKQGGTGLGLAVTRKILLDHGGEIRVESEPGHGSTFTLTLPVESALPLPRKAGQESGVEPEPRSGYGEN